MSRETWHKASYAKLRTRVFLNGGLPARAVGYGNYPLTPDDRLPRYSSFSDKWALGTRDPRRYTGITLVNGLGLGFFGDIHGILTEVSYRLLNLSLLNTRFWE